MIQFGLSYCLMQESFFRRNMAINVTDNELLFQFRVLSTSSQVYYYEAAKCAIDLTVVNAGSSASRTVSIALV